MFQNHGERYKVRTHNTHWFKAGFEIFKKLFIFHCAVEARQFKRIWRIVSVETTVNQFKCGQNMLLKLDVAATVALWSCNQTKAKCYVISCWLHMLISCKLTRLVYGMEMVHSIGLTNLAHWRDIDRQTVSECFKTTERLSLPIRMPDFSEVGFSRPNMS